MDSVLDWVIRNFGWGFVLIAIGALVFCIVAAVSPIGRVRLGPDDSRPEFSTVSWVAMMFAAGLGLGLMFYGVAEPISHFAAPPHGLAEPRNQEAGAGRPRDDLLPLGLQRLGDLRGHGPGARVLHVPQGHGTNLVSATFTPLLGERASESPIGRMIDSLAIFATLFGTATSLGLGALQINSGMNFLWAHGLQRVGVAIIIVITALFVLSAVSGVERGIQFLSNLSGGATIALMVFFLVAGPTVFIIGT